MRYRTWPWVMVGLAFATSFLVAPARPPAPLPSVPPQTLAIGVVGNPGTLDPARASSFSAWAVIANVFQPLWQETDHGLKPLLVDRYRLSGKRLTITLKKGVHLNDGQPLSAQDVASSLARDLWPATDSPLADRLLAGVRGARAVIAGKTRTLTGVQVTGRLTLTITFTRTVGPALLKTFSNPALSIVPARDPEQGGPNWQFTNLFGTGPYRLTNWVPGGQLNFRRVGRTGPKQVSVTIEPNWATAQLSFENRLINALPVPADQVSRLAPALRPALSAFKEPGQLALVFRRGAKHVSRYPAVGIASWVHATFSPRALTAPGSWPRGLPNDRRMTVYVDRSDAEAVALAEHLHALYPKLVQVVPQARSQIEREAKAGAIGCYLGSQVWFQRSLVMPIMPRQAFWLFGAPWHATRVSPQGALLWASVTPRAAKGRDL